MTITMIVFSIIFGSLLNIIPRQSAFVAACLSLSSTPLVVKFLGAGNQRKEKEDGKLHVNVCGFLFLFVLRRGRGGSCC